jgi:hypothetical protein
MSRPFRFLPTVHVIIASEVFKKQLKFIIVAFRYYTAATTTNTTTYHRLESKRIRSTKHKKQQLHGMDINDKDLNIQASEFANNNEQTLRRIAKVWAKDWAKDWARDWAKDWAKDWARDWAKDWAEQNAADAAAAAAADADAAAAADAATAVDLDSADNNSSNNSESKIVSETRQAAVDEEDKTLLRIAKDDKTLRRESPTVCDANEEDDVGVTTTLDATDGDSTDGRDPVDDAVNVSFISTDTTSISTSVSYRGRGGRNARSCDTRKYYGKEDEETEDEDTNSYL